MTPEQRAEAREYDRMHTSGAELIAGERSRQQFSERWTPEHDDEYKLGELATAAECYLRSGDMGVDRFNPPSRWPWAFRWWKPTPEDRIKELVKAGALIAAEIERLQRIERAGKSTANGDEHLYRGCRVNVQPRPPRDAGLLRRTAADQSGKQTF